MAVRRFKCQQPLCPDRVGQYLMRVCPVPIHLQVPDNPETLKTDPNWSRSTELADTKTPNRCFRKSFPPSSCASVQSTPKCSCHSVIFVKGSEAFRWKICVVLTSYCDPCRKQRDHVKEEKIYRKHESFHRFWIETGHKICFRRKWKAYYSTDLDNIFYSYSLCSKVKLNHLAISLRLPANFNFN